MSGVRVVFTHCKALGEKRPLGQISSGSLLTVTVPRKWRRATGLGLGPLHGLLASLSLSLNLGSAGHGS
jgi:hypothetical protein